MTEFHYEIELKTTQHKYTALARFEDYDKAKEFYDDWVYQMEGLVAKHGNPEYDFSIELFQIEVISSSKSMKKNEWFTKNS